MNFYENHFIEVLDFIEKHQRLVNCHLVDFLTDDLWKKCIPLAMRLELEEIASKNFDIDWWNTKLSVELNNFKSIAQSLTLDACSDVIHFKNWSVPFPESKIQELDDHFSRKKQSKFMKDKKWHEVDTFARAIVRFAKSNVNLIIDAGAGKAYLSEHLSKTYNIPVLAIESSISHHNSALRRNHLIKRKKCSSPTRVLHINENIDEATNYSDLVKTHFPHANINDNILLVGLHTCGILTHSISKSFIQSDNIKWLCVVPCCYHLMSDIAMKNVILSRNARMLAQQSIERTYCKSEPLRKTLFYRTILQVLFKSMELTSVKVGRGAPLTDFPSYAQWALLKIGIPEEKMPSRDSLEHLYKIYATVLWKYEAFHILRMHLAPVLEAAIILDVVKYLQQNVGPSKITVVQLFDSTVSPRKYAIMATK